MLAGTPKSSVTVKAYSGTSRATSNCAGRPGDPSPLSGSRPAETVTRLVAAAPVEVWVTDGARRRLQECQRLRQRRLAGRPRPEDDPPTRTVHTGHFNHGRPLPAQRRALRPGPQLQPADRQRLVRGGAHRFGPTGGQRDADRLTGVRLPAPAAAAERRHPPPAGDGQPGWDGGDEVLAERQIRGDITGGRRRYPGPGGVGRRPEAGASAAGRDHREAHGRHPARGHRLQPQRGRLTGQLQHALRRHTRHRLSRTVIAVGLT
jgi:hypothetical protein